MTNKTIWINTKHLEETASTTYTFTLSLAPQSDIISVHGKTDTDTVKALHVDHLPDDAFKRKSHVFSHFRYIPHGWKNTHMLLFSEFRNWPSSAQYYHPWSSFQYINLSKGHCKTIRHRSPYQKPMQVLGPVTVFHNLHMYMLVIISEISSSIYPN